MDPIYKNALEKLIDIITESKDKILINHGRFEKSKGSLISLGDKRFGAYSSMVSTNEFRAVKTIELLAVELFTKHRKAEFCFYPISDKFKNCDIETQKKSRPFQIVLSENNLKSGVVFCDCISEIGKYYDCFMKGQYLVDTLKIVIISQPDISAHEVLFSSVNSMNKQSGVLIERIPILDFWLKYFGDSECEKLVNFCNIFNEKARSIIGFDTVITPTEKALDHFREKCGKMILEYDYTINIPTTVYTNQVDTIKSNYLDRGLWKAMIGKENFAVSFITSEWFYTMYQLSENLDLTNIVSGYLKSVEQLLFAVIQLSEGTGVTVMTKKRKVVEYIKENADIIDTTLGALENVIKYNKQILDVNKYAKEYLTDTVANWRSQQRNGYFHKDNLHDLKKVDEIRNKALELYFLILGSCTIKEDQFKELGINDD